MHIPLKAYILLVLSITCLFMSWQGINPPFNGSAVGVENSERYIPEANRNHVLNQATPDISGTNLDTTTDALPESDPPSVFQDRWISEHISVSGFEARTSMYDPVIIAILDTGIDVGHEDLADIVINQINFTESHESGDVHGHGTHIAGIIAANPDNGYGIDGIAPDSLLLNVKVADDRGRCRSSVLAEGIIWSVDNGANIINISIEMRENSLELEEAIDYAWNNGVVIIAAAGNDGSDRSVYPAAQQNCISVTALRDEMDLAPLANYGDWVDVAAPGYQIYSTLPGSTYGYKHGTSFAAAYVTGLAARLYPIVEDTSGNSMVNDEIMELILALCNFDLPDWY